MAATKSLGPTGLAELWSLVKTYVSQQSAASATPPVGYCLVNGGTNPASDGYGGTWTCMGQAEYLAFPSDSTYPSELLRGWGAAGLYVWRRTA